MVSNWKFKSIVLLINYTCSYHELIPQHSHESVALHTTYWKNSSCKQITGRGCSRHTSSSRRGKRISVLRFTLLYKCERMASADMSSKSVIYIITSTAYLSCSCERKPSENWMYKVNCNPSSPLTMREVGIATFTDSTLRSVSLQLKV